MDFETEKLLAKISGENVENFAACVISPAIKNQIDFAFEQMFSGLSLIQWMKGGLLIDAWNVALDKMRDFIFSIEQSNYMVDYLRTAVFDFKKHKSKDFHNSVHATEYFRSDANMEILEKAGHEKIQNGVDIIKNLISNPKQCVTNQKTNDLQHEYQYEHEKERERTK